MALRIKLARRGSAHNPVYRIVVAEARSKRDGRFVEWIGTYSPKAPHGKLSLELDRADYWMGMGATPTDTVRSLINRERRRREEVEAAAEASTEPKAEAVAEAEPTGETSPGEEAES